MIGLEVRVWQFADIVSDIHHVGQVVVQLPSQRGGCEKTVQNNRFASIPLLSVLPMQVNLRKI